MMLPVLAMDGAIFGEAMAEKRGERSVCLGFPSLANKISAEEKSNSVQNHSLPTVAARNHRQQKFGFFL
jgi:hypothetical protein